MLDTMLYLEDINGRKLYLQIGFGNVIFLDYLIIARRGGATTMVTFGHVIYIC